MSIGKNTTYNIMGSIIPLAISLVTIPIYLDLIGEARYGILAMAWLLLGYFGIFDLGLGRATAHRIASIPRFERKERALTFWTAFALNVALGIIGALVLWYLSTYFSGSTIDADTLLQEEIDASIFWLVLALPMATVSGVLIGALQGDRKFLELNIVSIFGSAAFQIIPLLVAKFGSPQLQMLLPAALAARLFVLFILFGLCKRHIIFGESMGVEVKIGLRLIKYGGWVTVTSLIGPLMVILDRFLILSVSGPSAVTQYTVPFQLAERTTIISGALASALFPRLANTTLQEGTDLTLRALNALAVAITVPILFGMVIMAPFLSVWVGTEFATRAAPVGIVLLLGFWFNSLAMIPLINLQASGRPDLVAKAHLVELLPYLGILYLMLDWLGIFGAAISFSLRAACDYFILSASAGFLRKAVLVSAIPATILLGACVLGASSSIEEDSFQSVQIALIAGGLLWVLVRIPKEGYSRGLSFLIGKLRIGGRKR